jgi:hypothetical protein
MNFASMLAWIDWVHALSILKWTLVVLVCIGGAVFALVLVPPLQNVLKKPCLSWAAIAVCVVFQVPWGKRLLKRRDALWARYRTVGGTIDGDRVVAYVERIVDRQINKGRGILPFNSILMSFLAFEAQRHIQISDQLLLDNVRNLHPWILAALAISSVLLLELFWVRWSKRRIYTSFSEELTSACVLVRDRSLVLDVAIILSLASVVSILVVEFLAPPTFG